MTMTKEQVQDLFGNYPIPADPDFTVWVEQMIKSDVLGEQFVRENPEELITNWEALRKQVATGTDPVSKIQELFGNRSIPNDPQFVVWAENLIDQMGEQWVHNNAYWLINAWEKKE
jgi:hypothetical protein